MIVISLGLCSIFLLNFKYPNFNRSVQRQVREGVRQRSYLNAVDLDYLDQQINQLMIAEEVFTNSELSLGSLSKMLNLTMHQLSQFLNEKKGKNFKAYINDYRIQKAKCLLKTDPQESVLDIAFRVGFKSKSTFNTSFQKNTGITPTQYRKENP